MSAYIQFFIRHENAFLPIGIFCRSNEIYQCFNEYVPYGKIKPITKTLLNFVRNNVNDDIIYHQERLRRAVEMKKYVATMNNSMEEKMEWVDNIESMIDECKSDIDELQSVKHYLNFLQDILEAVEYETHIEMNKYLYVGIEVGDPTIDDVEEY